ncbi:hypothetical protein EsDP_00004205 [Epichloe bromicola]|uniref:DUF3752 domain-containing protein n=1 Tax=Epichloe bromicola TaxID=79588 RepID=A0ABQ0CR07_9HYPO
MSSIGPQLPADLTKRKRTPDSDDAHNPSPPSKQARRDAAGAANNEEINMNMSDSDQDIGPSAPPATSPEAEPAIPSNAHEIDLSDSDSDTGPAQPRQPQPQPRHRASPSSPSSEDEDEDDYGPSLPSLTTARPPIGPTLPSSEPAPQRDTWMLAPPPQTAYSERDPTRLRARKFASKPSAKRPSSPGNLSSIWTETPQEKLRRQRDALLGRAPSACAGPGPGPLPARDSIQEQRDRRIAESIDATRGKSLYDEHSQTRKHAAASSGAKIEDDDDPSKRAFDREKDMAVGAKIGTKARTELISKSANFGARFQKGSFL